MATKEFHVLELHAFDAIGSMLIGDVRPSHIKSILEDAVANRLKKRTIGEIRGALRHLFGSALESELIAWNPVVASRLQSFAR